MPSQAGIRAMSLTAALLSILPSAAHCADLPIAEFLGNSFEPWTATGTAFKNGPATGDLLTKLKIENAAADARVISSAIDGDQPMGTLTSPPFKIERRFIGFRIAGGDYETATSLDLLIDGKVVRSATGWRSDRLIADSWDVQKWSGMTAQIRVVDTADADWGHINVDRIVQTDSPAQPPRPTAPLYAEALRPQFHFTARQWTMNRLNPREREEGWLNDLNGLIYYDGEYHLFAQRWAKCWLHAVSRDMIHWTELEPAFWEESLGSGVQSGYCVIDYDNTSGLARDKHNPAMVAFWSRFDQKSQCISYSLDHGRTWTFYEKNPIFVMPERDPKVFWYAPGRHWVMIMYGHDAYHILTSPDLLHWKDENNPISNSFECPDFFQLPLDGNKSAMKWVLIQGNGNYSIGSFDGKKFTEETPRRPCDIGDFYATQSWHNTDTGDGRRVQVAWMRGSHFPDMPFNQMVSFPCELTLHSSPAGLRLFRKPIAEIASLHGPEESWTNRRLEDAQSLPLMPAGQQFHITAKLKVPEQGKLTFNVRGIPVIFTDKSVECAGRTALSESPLRSIELLVDTTSIEIFLNAGEVSLTRFVLPKENGLSIKSEGDALTIESLSVFPLRSAWPETPSATAGTNSKPQ